MKKKISEEVYEYSSFLSQIVLQNLTEGEKNLN